MASAEIYNKALDLLSRREHSRKELFLKLINRFESQEEINLTLDKLEGKNLLSDSRFAEEYVQARRKKGFGPIKISAELDPMGSIQKGGMRLFRGFKTGFQNQFLRRNHPKGVDPWTCFRVLRSFSIL